MGDFNSSFENNIAFQIDYTANFNKSFRRRFNSKYIDSEILPDEFSIIYIVSKLPDISQVELARYLFKGKAHIGKILKEMEIKNLVKRTSSSHSAPAKIILLPQAKQIYAKGMKEIETLRSKFEEEFSEEEIKQFLLFLKRYRKVMSSLVEVNLK